MKLSKKESLWIAIPLAIIFVASIGIGIFFIILRSRDSICFFEECVLSVKEKFASSDLDEICMAKKCLYKRGNETKSDPVCVPKACVLDEDYHRLETITVCISRPCLIEDPQSNDTNARIQNCIGPDCPLPTSESRKGEVCATDYCTMTAAKMLKWMDRGVDPCENFYDFSCNGFIHTHSVENERDTYSVEDIAAEETATIIKDILESPNIGNESDALQKAKAIYLSCIFEGEADKISSAMMLTDVLSRYGIGNWPMLELSLTGGWTDCRIDLEWRMAMLNKFGVDSLFHLEVDFKGIDSISHIGVYLSQPLVKGICSDNISEARSSTEKYKEMFVSVLELFEISGWTKEEEINNVLNFDATFCKITKSSQKETKSSKVSEYSFKDIRQIIPSFNWKRWKNILLDELNVNGKLNDSSIYVYGDEMILHDVLELYQRTSSKTLANYLTWKFVFSHLSVLGNSFKKIAIKYSSFFQDQMPYFFFPESSVSLRTSCSTYLESMMNIALIPSFLSKVNTPDVKKEVNNLVFLIKQSFKDTFYKNEDLGENDKKKLINKTEIVDVVFSYPDENETFYNEYYSGIGPFGNSFRENCMKLSAFRQKKLFEAVIHGSNHTDLELQVLIKNPFRKNAIAAFRENKLVLFLGELLISGVSHKLPQYLNFGSFGWTVAHELAYGFNPLFLSYNDVYRNVPGNWTEWPDYIVERLEKKARCFSSNFHESEAMLIERNENENITDNGEYEKSKEMEMEYEERETFTANEYAVNNQGMEETFKGYRSYESWHGSEPMLPGLQYNGEKLFFIRFAQLCCSVESAENKKGNNIQLLNSEKVNGVLRNVEAFAEVFNCPFDSPMNTPKKCKNFW